jgi:copper chaperone CopZ
MSGAGCSGKEAEINKILQAIPGVLSVDFNRIPDHVLVDITPSSVKPEDVLNRVNETASSWQCKVEIIEGCISAKMPTASAAPHQHE